MFNDNQPAAVRPGGVSRPRYRYSDAGYAIHGKRCLRPVQRALLDAAFLRLKLAAPGSDERKKAFNEIQRMPVSIVPIRYAALQDYSRYPGERLRNIAADGGGAKEKARAARRVAAKVSVTAPLLAEAA